MVRLSLTALCAVLGAACSPPAPSPPLTVAAGFPSGTFVDLSHSYNDQTVFWPTSERFRLDKVADGITAQGYYYTANNFCTAEHGGTHIDAPRHFAQGRRTVDEIPLDQLVGQAVVIDVAAQSVQTADYQVTAGDVQQWEKVNGRIPDDAIVLIRTGFSRRWPDAARYLGTAERGTQAVAKLHFPGLHPDATRWLLENRSIDAIGIDTASIDHGQSTLFETHRVLNERNIPAFENLTNLERLPPTGSFVIALPLKIEGGSGGPLRAMAIVPEEK